METVWKYDLTISDVGDCRTIEVPVGAKFIHVDLEPSNPTPDSVRVWALVNPNNPKRSRTLRVAGTGHPIQGDVSHIGSVRAGRFMWHVFEVIK